MNKEFKFLAIKNWHKYQAAKRNCAWIKDHVSKDEDLDFIALTFFQRGVLDALCRLRGRIARNIHNDLTYLVRALHALPTDAPHIGHAIDTLASHGFLIFTNEQDALLEERRIEKNREEERPQNTITPSVAEPGSNELDKHSAARGLGELIGMGSSGFNLGILVSAIEQGKRRWPEVRNEEVAERITGLWKEYTGQNTHVKVSLKNWLDTVGRFIDSDDWRVGKKAAFIPQVDWQGGHIGEDSVYINRAGKRMPGFKCPPKPTHSEVV